MILFKMHFSIFFYLKHKPKIAASFIATNIIASLIATKGPSNQSYGFPSSHVRMWKLDCKESWVLKKWCFWTAVLQKTLEGPLDCKEIQPVNPKGNRSWIFIGKTDAEAETPILCPPDEKNWLTGEDPDAGKDWRQEETGMTEDEMFGWHHRLDGQEFELMIDREAWRAAVHGFAKSWTRMSDWTELIATTIFLVFFLFVLFLFFVAAQHAGS